MFNNIFTTVKHPGHIFDAAGIDAGHINQVHI